MAEKKRTTARKTSSGKTGGTQSTRSKSKRSSTKRRSKKQKQEDLMQSLALFGIGVLLIIMVFMPGQSLWLILRTFLFGVFGAGMYLLGAVIVYLAVRLAQGKPLLRDIVKAVFGMIMLSGTIAVFSRIDTQELTTVAQVVQAYYKNGHSHIFGCGVAGLPVGWVLLYLCGRPAANVIMIVLAVCAVMVIFGISPAEVWSTVSYYGSMLIDGPKTAIEETGEGYRRRRDERLEKQQARQMELEDYADEEDEPEEKTGVFAAIGGFFADLFAGKDDEEEQEQDDEQEQPQDDAAFHARAASNKRTVMETALQNTGEFSAEPVSGWDTDDADPEPSADPDEMVVIGPGGTFGMHPWEETFAEPKQEQPPKKPAEPDFILPDMTQYMAVESPDTQSEGYTAVLPQTPDGPGPARIAPEPLDTSNDSDWVSITAQPPVQQAGAIENLAAAAMAKPAVAEQAAAAAPKVEQPKPVAYRYPPLDLFEKQKEESADARAELKANAEKLVSTLDSFGVKTRILDISRGPSVTRYELQPQAGVKISRITSLADDIALNLAVADVRIEAPIPGKPAVGIEVPNRKSTSVAIRSIFESSNYSRMASPLTIALGKDIAGVAQVADLCKMPHLLIAGSTGSGKSVCVNSIIISFIYRSSPEDLKLILIDPKVVELAEYNGIPHLLMPVVTEPRKAAGALCSAVGEMERRYHLFAENNVRDIKTFNKLAAENPALEKLPYIAIVIDELADLMMVAGKEVEDYICRIAQKARAAGMHLIVATQRPSVDVITGLIKANIPSRIAFAVSSQVDSRTILDGAGAEKLLGMGDMLFLPVGAPKPIRVQGTYVTDEEISRTLNFIKAEHGAEYDESMIAAMEKAAQDNGKGGGDTSAGADDTDPMFRQCVECVLDAGQASTSLLQRRCKLGYARAARIMDEMEEKGVIGPYEGAKPRAVLISRQQWMEMSLNQKEPVPDEI